MFWEVKLEWRTRSLYLSSVSANLMAESAVENTDGSLFIRAPRYLFPVRRRLLRKLKA